MNLSGPPPAPSPPPPPIVDVSRDPRIRYTFADVAMKLAHDGPWYVVMVVIALLAVRGTATAVEALNGIALVLLGRSRPPDAPDKAHLIRGIAGGALVLLVMGVMHVALNPQPLPPLPAALPRSAEVVLE